MILTVFQYNRANKDIPQVQNFTKVSYSASHNVRANNPECQPTTQYCPLPQSNSRSLVLLLLSSLFSSSLFFRLESSSASASERWCLLEGNRRTLTAKKKRRETQTMAQALSMDQFRVFSTIITSKKKVCSEVSHSFSGKILRSVKKELINLQSQS